MVNNQIYIVQYSTNEVQTEEDGGWSSGQSRSDVAQWLTAGVVFNLSGSRSNFLNI